MTKILAGITAKVRDILNEQGIAPDKLVTVTVDESLSDIAKRTRQEAEKQGMTDKIVNDLMKDR